MTSDPCVCVFGWMWGGVAMVTRVGVVDAEALVPEAGDEEEAIIGRDEETVRVHLHTLIQ